MKNLTKTKSLVVEDISLLLPPDTATGSEYSALIYPTGGGPLLTRAVITPDESQTITNKTITGSTGTFTSAGIDNLTGILTLNSNTTLRTNGSITTTDATPSTLYTIPTTTDTILFLTVKTIGVKADGDSGIYTLSSRAKNLSGVVTLGTPFNQWDDIESGLTNTSIGVSVSGTDILVRVTGLAATTIKWRGTAEVITLDI